MLLLVPELLFFVFLLVVDGEPFRFAFLRRLPLFSNLDLIQICILDVFVGGFALYVLSMFPIPLFTLYVVAGFTVFCLFFSIYVHSKALRELKKPSAIKSLLTENKRPLLDYALVVLMFFILLLLQLSALSNFVLGGVFDESIHSLKVQVILENGFVPMTLQPYLPEGIIYPQAAHVIFAFAYYILNFTVPKAVFYITILFKSLSVFGAYFLGKKLSSNRMYPLALSFVFTFVSAWPLFVSWGTNPFLVGFPLFLVDLGLFFPLVHSEAKNTVAELAAVGLLFGFSGAIMVSFYEALVFVAVFALVYWFAKKRDFVRRKLLELVGLFSFSLLPLGTVFYRFFAFFQYPGHNVGLPADFAGYQTTSLSFTLTQALQWAFENLSPFFLMRVLTLIFLFSLPVLFWVTRDTKDIKPVVAFALSIFASSSALSFISFFLPSDFQVISWGHQGIIIAVSLCILLLAFYERLVKMCKSLNFGRIFKSASRTLHANILLAIIVLASVNAPFVYYRFFVDPAALAGSYRFFAVTSSDDYSLMLWMSGNVSSDAIVLVSPYESGLFIPAISHNKIVYPYTGSAFTRSYQNLVNMTCRNILNETAYALMLDLSISHVFIGSDAAYWWFERQKWDPMLFLGNPNFKLVKNLGDAYLFQFNYTSPHTVFFDDFEHKQWDEDGWRAHFYGNGVTNVAITNSSEQGLGSGQCLKMTSQASYTLAETKCASYIEREIFVDNNSDVTLSFHVNASEGFHGKDTFAAIISNIYHNQSIVVETPKDGVFQDYAYTTTLNGSSFDLSMMWHKAYDSPLPTDLILEFVNYDTDGIKNVAYLDNVTITSTPVT